MQMSARNKTPVIAQGCFVAPTACLIGDVQIGEQSSVWFNTVLRGDVEPIIIGRQSNIQDGSIIHGTFARCGTVIHDRVTIGHLVMLHGCEVGSGSLVGMGSIVMDLAKIGDHSLVGAGSLVTEKCEFPPESLILGRPAKFIRKLRKDEIENLEKSADNYLHYMTWYS